MRPIRKLRALAIILGMDCVQICLDLCHVFDGLHDISVSFRFMSKNSFVNLLVLTVLSLG
jgi:endonuclease IV